MVDDGADTDLPSTGPEYDFRRYATEPTGNGYAATSMILGIIGTVHGVNLWTITLLFLGGPDLFIPPLFGAAALALAGLAPAHTGRTMRIIGFVTGGMALVIGIATFMSF